jgi:type III restriction enzyme
VTLLLRKVAGRWRSRTRRARHVCARARTQGVYLSEDFKALWDRIKHKTTYRVQFDNDKLISRLRGTIRRCCTDRPSPGCSGARRRC